LRTLAVHQQVNSGGGLANPHRAAETRTSSATAIYMPRAAGAAHIFDAVLAGGMHFLRELCGPSFMPSEVLVAAGGLATDPVSRSLSRGPALRRGGRGCASRRPGSRGRSRVAVQRQFQAAMRRIERTGGADDLGSA
jgi:hypothetical protein